MTPSIKPDGTRRNAEICGRTSPTRNHSRIVEPICSKLLFYKKKRMENYALSKTTDPSINGPRRTEMCPL
jgi:hypothetical protein